MNKNKDVFLYHPTCTDSDGVDFASLLIRMEALVGDGLTVESRGVRSVLRISSTGSIWIISLQNLSNDDLPKIANDSDGKDERGLSIPDGKSLSYKNYFIFRAFLMENLCLIKITSSLIPKMVY